MNHSLVVKEIQFLVDTLRDRLSKNAESAGYVLSDSFFRTPDVFSTEVSSNEKKNKRQEDIISLLKERSDLSVKDFTQIIKDCSEKTVQRELLELVEKGIVKKQGERRWSRYSLR